MEQLKKAYEAIEMLKALDLPVSDEQLRRVAEMEKNYLKEEVIPLLKQELEPMVEKMRSKFFMEVMYNKDNGLTMKLLDPSETRSVSETTPRNEEATRDTTKYSIDGGKPLMKRRFVLTVVKKYVENHPSVTFNELKVRFPDSLSRKPIHGVFQRYEDVRKKIESQPDLENRFFLQPEELITLSDGTKVTVYNQWGNNFQKFLEVAQQLHEVECSNS